MKIAFIGSVEFSASMLSQLMEVPGVEISGVVTRKLSAFNSDFCDLTEIAKKKNIPVFYAEGNNQAAMAEFIQKCSADVIYCFGWSYLLKDEILKAARLGVVGFHPAELPANRGRHPLIWALVLGLKQTASTFFWMDKGADSGPILSQKIIPIDYCDDARRLYDKMTEVARQQVVEFTQQLQKNHIVRIEQDHSKANSWRKRGRSDGKIDFRMNSENIYNLVRALAKPYVGAHIETSAGDVKVWQVKVRNDINTKNIESGYVIASNEKTFLVKTGDSALEILEHEFSQTPHAGSYL